MLSAPQVLPVLGFAPAIIPWACLAERLTILSVLRAIFEMFFFMAFCVVKRFWFVFCVVVLFDDSKLQPKTNLQKSNTAKRSKRNMSRKNELPKRFEQKSDAIT